MNIAAEYAAYTSALALKLERPDVPAGTLPSGWYRVRVPNPDGAAPRYVPFVIWRDTGAVVAQRGDDLIVNPETIEKIYMGRVQVVSAEAYDSFMENGHWPDGLPDMEDEEDYSKLEPHEAARRRGERLATNCQTWLATLPQGISSDDEDNRLKAYTSEIAAIEKRAEDTRVSLKEPHLEAGRQIDAAWTPVVKDLKAARTRLAQVSTDYRVRRAAEEKAKQDKIIAEQRAEQDRVAKENRRILDEATKAAAETGEPVKIDPEMFKPAPPVVTAPPRPTGLRTVKELVFTDMRAFLEYVAKMNECPPDILAASKIVARKLLTAGVQVPGAEMRDVHKAS